MQFSKLEPIRFGDFEATPSQLTTETKLRVSALKFDTDASINEAVDVLSGCFGAQAAQVKEFMVANMFPMDYQRLQAYLIGGNEGVKRIDKVMDAAIMSAVTGGQNATA